MPWNLLILPLIGGYVILSRSYRFRYKSLRLDRQRLLFDSIIIGAILLAATILLRSIIEWLDPALTGKIYRLFPVKSEYLGTAIVSFLLAWLFVFAFNLTLFRDKAAQVSNAIKSVGNELDLLLRSALNDEQLLELTLDTGKVYIVQRN